MTIFSIETNTIDYLCVIEVWFTTIYILFSSLLCHWLCVSVKQLVVKKLVNVWTKIKTILSILYHNTSNHKTIIIKQKMIKRQSITSVPNETRTAYAGQIQDQLDSGCTKNNVALKLLSTLDRFYILHWFFFVSFGRGYSHWIVGGKAA